MDAEFSDDQELLRESVRRYLDRSRVAGLGRARCSTSLEARPTPVWHGLAAIGCCGLAVPEAHGGAGGGMVDLGVVLEELGRTVHPGPFLSSAVGAVGALLEADDPDACADLLPSLADGSCVGTVAFEETGRPRHGHCRPRPPGPSTASSTASPARRCGCSMQWPPTCCWSRRPATTPVFGCSPSMRRRRAVTITARPTIDGTRRFADVELRDVAGRRIGSRATRPAPCRRWSTACWCAG